MQPKFSKFTTEVIIDINLLPSCSNIYNTINENRTAVCFFGEWRAWCLQGGSFQNQWGNIVSTFKVQKYNGWAWQMLES